MSATATPTAVGSVDAALDRLQQHRERILAEAPGAVRSTRMAELYEHEAGLWSVLFEHTGTRVYWRAALTAEVYARQSARHWRRRATAEARGLPTSARLGGCVEVGEWAKRWQTDLTRGAS
ncbi:MAG: hypothetical protein M3313_01870 [Actinomycetota bacterium]|nr:hypothetical protein [Actinomycetota bacterium]